MTVAETVAVAVMAFGLGALSAVVATAWVIGVRIDGKDEQ